MGRQRTINDQNFWRDPRLLNCTTEDKVALLHLLTCPDSNIIGAYPLIPRIAGAEIGWTQDQWLQVMDRLQAADLTWYDGERMFVWVRIWWSHHSAGQVLGPKLRSRTLENIRCLPEAWTAIFLEDFRKHLNGEHQTLLQTILQTDGLKRTGELPYAYGIDQASNDVDRNSNSNSNSKGTTTPARSPAGTVDISAIPILHREEVAASLKSCRESGVALVEPQTVVDALARQFKSATNPPRSPGALTRYLAQQLQQTEVSSKPPARATQDELAALEGRCFAWPHTNPRTFIRICDAGRFDQFCREGGSVVRSVGWLEQTDLLKPIQEGRVREVSPAVFEEVARESVR